MKFLISIAVSLMLFAGTAKGDETKTVGTGANYTTLKAAFDAINAGTLKTGVITLQIVASTTESASAVLNASGTGSSNYASVIIYPTAACTISTSGNWAAIDLNGADHVTIDGRINMTGTTNSLSITGTNTGNGAAAIRLVNSSENNTIRYCNLSGSSASSAMGVVSFGGSSDGNGNDNNILEYCNITSSGSNRPYNGILSAGTGTRENNGVIIRNNNIYNTFQTGVSSNSININSASVGFTVSGNSIYETAPFTTTSSSLSYNAIRVSTSVEHTITGNYIGGSGPMCAGGAWSFTAPRAVYFCAIYAYAGTTPTTISNNTIANMVYSSKEDNPWDGIFLYTGNFEVTGNTVGATTGTGSITLTTTVPVATTTLESGGISFTITMHYGGSGYTTAPLITFTAPPVGGTAPTATANLTNGVVTSITVLTQGSGYLTAPSVIFDGQSNNYSTSHGMIQNSTGTVNITGNNIGSITTVGSDFYSHGFESIYIRTIAATTTLSNNLIGSLTTPNSINVSSAAASSRIKQDVYGIYSSSTGTTTITGNTVANLTNAYAGDIQAARTRGIQTTSGTNVIQNNTVRKLSAATKENSSGAGASVIGISQTSTAGTSQTITGNTIYDLSNTYATRAKVQVYGVYYAGPNSGTNSVSGNFVRSLSVSSADSGAVINGIVINSGLVTCANNIVSLGGNTIGYLINGIWDGTSTGNTVNLYFNTVYIGGSVTGVATSNTAGLWNANNTSTRNYRDNILVNARSGGTTGKHYSIVLPVIANLTIDYNDYVSSSGTLGRIASAEKADLTAWKSGTGQDANSQSINPSFAQAGGSSAINYYPSALLLTATPISGISTDYYGITRGLISPKMGALEQDENVWQGATSSDFNTTSNWTNNAVPSSGADIIFATTPDNDCVLDANRTVGSISNGSSKNLIVNGKTLTVNNNLNFTSSGKINTSIALSTVKFAGSAAQTIPSAAFVSNSIAGLTIDNSSGVALNGDLTASAALIVTNGNFTVGANTLTISGSTLTRTGGGINASSAGATLEFANSSTITLPASVFSADVTNLTISGAGGITAVSDFTINGILNLQSANPSASKGLLDMRDGAVTKTLTMGANATITGTSDVTGIVKRQHTFTKNISYAFGSQFTTIAFIDDNLKPEWISLKISIGAAPAWSSWAPLGKVRRYYNIAVSDNSSTAHAVVDMRYLLSELDAVNNDESKLVFWHKIPSFNSGLPHEHGKSNQNFVDHYIGVTGITLGTAATTNLADSEIALAYSLTTKNTWKGEVSGDQTKWEIAGNWTAGHVPLSTEDILIPSGLTYYPSLTASSGATAKSIEIEAGASLSANDYDITIAGFQGAWINDGTFYPGSGKVTFNHGVPAEIVTVDGVTNFYDIEAGENTAMQPVAGCILRIAGTGTAYASSIVDFSTIENTVEYNGSNQTIVNPSGLNGNSGYYNLVLSGSGTKTMAASAMTIRGDFTISGTAMAVAGGQVTTAGNMSIGPLASYTAGNHIHSYANFIISSDATGTGSLIANSSFTGTVERYITHDLKWHFLSSPVATQPIWPEFAPEPVDDPLSFGPAPWAWDLFYWNPKASTVNELYWVNIRQDNSGAYNSREIDAPGSVAGFGTAVPQFTKGRGYLVDYGPGYVGNSLHNFSGNINFRSQTIAVTTSTYNKWNLAGNPYPSAIDWRDSTGWNRTKLADSASYWIYNASDGSGNYGVYNATSNVGTLGTSKYIAPMQGFFVEAASEGNVSITNAVQVHASQVWLKESQDANNILRLKLTTSANTYKDEMIVAVNPSFVNGGSMKFWSMYNEAPELYAIHGSDLYSIDLLSSVNENTTIPIGIKAGLAANYTIEVSGIETFFVAKSILLEDLKTGSSQELKTNPSYSFSANPGDDPGRFILHFGGPYGIASNVNQPDYSVFAFNNSVVIKNISGRDINGTATICNILGQKVLQQKIVDQTTKIDLTVPSGCYIVSVMTDLQSFSKKIIIH